MKKILVLTSGGDAPGMNAAIRAVVRTAAYHDIDVVGARNGYRGLLDGDLIEMSPRSVANCIQRGGTILRTERFAEFKEKSVRDQARKICDEHGIDGLVVIGGDGSFRGATLLAQEGGPKCMGIPATIDNDILGTDYTIGFDTARNTALEAIDKIRDTASSHNRNFLVEVMGRNAGFLAVDVGLAGGAEFILIPERPVTLDQLIENIEAPRRRKSSSIIVVAEADQPNRVVSLADELKQRAELEYKVCVLGHVQRGGSPTAYDRLMGSMMGEKAVVGLMNGETQKMMALSNNEMKMVAFPDSKAGSRQFDNEELLKINDVLCA